MELQCFPKLASKKGLHHVPSHVLEIPWPERHRHDLLGSLTQHRVCNQVSPTLASGLGSGFQGSTRHAVQDLPFPSLALRPSWDGATPARISRYVFVLARFWDAGDVASVRRRKPHQYWRVCDARLWLETAEKDKRSKAPLFLLTRTHRKKGKPSFRLWPSRFQKEARASFRPSEIYTKQRGTNTMKESPHLVKGSKCSNCNKIRRIPDEPAQLKRACRSRSFFLHFLSPRPYSFSVTARPTVRGRLILLWHWAFSGSINPTYQASCISWHNISMAMWQLNATLASSQSSRKRERETLSSGPYYPMTSSAPLHTLFSRETLDETLSSSDQASSSLSHIGPLGQPNLHVSRIRSSTTTLNSALFRRWVHADKRTLLKDISRAIRECGCQHRKRG